MMLTTALRRLARRSMSGMAVASAAIAIAGCAYVGFEAAYLIRDEQAFNENIEAAQAGDPVAQFEVGKSRCCGIGGGGDFYYSTRDATAWLCASARQGYGPAMLQLGHIYSGEIIEEYRVFRSGVAALQEEPVNRSIAYVWYQSAYDAGASEAGTFAYALRRDLNPRETAIARALLADPAPKPCIWDDVMNPVYRQIFEEATTSPGAAAAR